MTEGLVFDVRLLTTVLVFLAMEAQAFDAGVWMERRSDFEQDALRLKAAYTNLASRVSESAEKVFIPLEVHPDGSVKTSISAEHAQLFLDEGLVWGDGVVIRQCDEHAKETSRIEAAKMVFDRSSRRGWAEGPAKVTHGETAFSGSNIYFATDEEYVLSFEDSAFNAKNIKAEGMAKGEALSVVSRRCDMDRKSGVVLFDRNARVDYEPDYTLCTDRVFAFFTGTNELERLVAVGNIAVTNGLRVGSCDRATFLRTSGELEMTGGEDGRLARLSDETGNSMAGRTIRFWTKKEQVEIIDSELIVHKEGRSIEDL